MFPDLIAPDVLPLRTVALQFLFLLVAIALEAIVLHRYLPLTYKTSVHYAATVNLLVVVVGWWCFFSLAPFLPHTLQQQLISFVFFNRFLANSSLNDSISLLLILAFLVFMGTWMLKVYGLSLLELLLGEATVTAEAEEAEQKVRRFQRRRNIIQGLTANDKIFAVLVANSVSFSAILILFVVLQFFMGEFLLLTLLPRWWGGG